MGSWSDFERADPELASFGRERLNDIVAYLATVRSDGSPRVHPVSARIREGRLFVRMDPASPKANDLRRDGRYALHSQVLDTSGSGGEFSVSGQAHLVDDSALLRVLTQGLPDPDRYLVFELDVHAAMSTRRIELSAGGGRDRSGVMGAPPSAGCGRGPSRAAVWDRCRARAEAAGAAGARGRTRAPAVSGQRRGSAWRTRA